MTREEFEAASRRDGYELGESTLAAGFHNPEHSHDFDVRALVLEGEFTLTCGGERRTYRAGDSFAFDRGVPHAEDVGPAGVRYVIGRRRG
jgi:quercetin dioxygenase-like cupin family protein